MQNKTYQQNTLTYEDRYGKEGYGLELPDGHLIRLYKHFLEPSGLPKGGRFQDYRCGSGIHSWYFARYGFVPYGCDVSTVAIEQAKRLLPKAPKTMSATRPRRMKIGRSA